MFKRFALGAAMAVAATTAAQAAIAIDGAYDAAYGGPTATVTYNSGAPTSNFGAPTDESNAIGYKIHLSTDHDYVYGYLETFGPGAPVDSFANLYFGGPFSIGFEITNDRAFRPGVPAAGYLDLGGLLDFATTATSVEFRIANSVFTGGAASLYGPSQMFPQIGDTMRLNLSQSFGYSVAGGQADYGNERLGTVTLGYVPEPATWAFMIMGFGAAGAMIRRRRAVAA